MRGEVEATQHADSFIPLRQSTIAMTQYRIRGNCWSPPPTFQAPGGVRLYARDPVLSDVTARLGRLHWWPPRYPVDSDRACGRGDRRAVRSRKHPSPQHLRDSSVRV
jgi:hypothetical protein